MKLTLLGLLAGPFDRARRFAGGAAPGGIVTSLRLTKETVRGVVRSSCIIAALLAGMAQKTRASDVVAAWTLDEAAAPYADSSGGASALTLDSGTAPAISGTGVLNGSAQLNWNANPGVSTRLCNYDAAVQRDSFGFSMWVRPVNLNPGDNLIGKEMAATSSGPEWSRLAWQLHVGGDDGSGKAQLELLVRGSNRAAGDFFGNVWSVGKVPLYNTNSPAWIHVSGGYDTVTGQLRLYVSGTEAIAQGTPGANNSDGGALALGSMKNGGTYITFAANAAIDDVQIFDTPPTASTVAAIIADPAAPIACPVVFPANGYVTAHWKLDEAGPSYGDWSGNLNNLQTDGVTSAPTQVPGIDGNARLLNWQANPGISTRLYAPGAAFQTDSFGFSFWVRPEYVTSWNNLLAKELGPVSGPDYLRMAWQIQVGGDDGTGHAPLVFVVRGSNRAQGDYFGSVQSSAAILLSASSASWVHIAGGYNAATGALTLIVNGQEFTAQGTPGADNSDGSYLSVGSVRNGTDFVAYSATAAIDDIQLYSEPLGGYEADYMMENPGGHAPAGLNTQVTSGGPTDNVTVTFNATPGVEYVVQGEFYGQYATLAQVNAMASPTTVTLTPVGPYWPPSSVRVAILKDFPSDGSLGYPPAEILPFVNGSEFVPQFHFSWPYPGTPMGDPCGLYKHNDQYHLFTWNHTGSTDLVSWDILGWPLQGAPPANSSIWTGTAIVDVLNHSGFGSTGNPPRLLFYTIHNDSTQKETIGMSYSTDGGINYYPYSSNPVITTSDTIFRDPDVFYDTQMGRWVMLVARSDQHNIQFWFSNDLKQWNNYSNFGPVGSKADYWECPSLFQIPVRGTSEKKWVLSVAAGLNKMQYFVGDFDGTAFTMDPDCQNHVTNGTGIDGVVFADFESGSYSSMGWTVSGNAFGSAPSLDSAIGYLGNKVADSKVSGDGKFNSTLTSPAFTITKNCINFLMAGGNFPGEVCVNLIVNGNPVESVTGRNSDILRWHGWDVSPYLGQTARIQIVDDYKYNWGHIYVDQIVFSDILTNTGREHANWVEAGEDFYSAKPVRDHDGNAQEVDWMGWICNWDYEAQRPVPNNWGKGALSLIRKLELIPTAKGYQLTQQPMPAMQKLRGNVVNCSPRVVNGTLGVDEFHPSTNTYELEATFDLSGTGSSYGLNLCASGSQRVVVGYDAKTSRLFIDRSSSGYVSWSPAFPKVIHAPLATQGNTLKLRIFVDQASVEIFADDGQCVLTSQIYPATWGTGVEVFSNGGATTLRSLRAWPLASIW